MFERLVQRFNHKIKVVSAANKWGREKCRVSSGLDVQAAIEHFLLQFEDTWYYDRLVWGSEAVRCYIPV